MFLHVYGFNVNSYIYLFFIVAFLSPPPVDCFLGMKWKRVKIAKYCSIRPILIHVNRVEESIYEQEYFDKIIDFSQLLKS